MDELSKVRDKSSKLHTQVSVGVANKKQDQCVGMAYVYYVYIGSRITKIS